MLHFSIVKRHFARSAIALKYQMRATALNVRGEPFKLAGQGAQGLGLLDWSRDIQRLRMGFRTSGWRELAVVLTNVSANWPAPQISSAFRPSEREREQRS